MSENIWIEKLDTSDGRVTVGVFGDPYYEGSTSTLRHSNLTARVHVNDESFDRLGLSASELRELARLLNAAAAHIDQLSGLRPGNLS
jgi:hypothetical protein